MLTGWSPGNATLRDPVLHCTWEPSSVPKAFGELEVGVLLERLLNRVILNGSAFFPTMFRPRQVHVKYIPPGQLVSMFKQMTDGILFLFSLPAGLLPAHVLRLRVENFPGAVQSISVAVCKPLGRGSAISRFRGGSSTEVQRDVCRYLGSQVVSTLTNTVFEKAKRRYTL